jgi:hypothetical protein
MSSRQVKKLKESTARRLSSSIVFLAIHRDGLGKLMETDLINLVDGDICSKSYTLDFKLTGICFVFNSIKFNSI